MIKNNPDEYITVGMIQDRNRKEWLARTKFEGSIMSKKHTPGPWAVRGSAGTSVYLLQNYGFSASGWASHNISEDQARADARLIAAAPDLLKALKNAVGHMTGNMDGDWDISDDPEGFARAAIAKAEVSS